IITALTQAVTLNPKLAYAHEELARLYSEMKYDDLALRHRDAFLALIRKAGRSPREEPGAFAQRIERLEQSVDLLRNRVQDSENRFAVRTQSLKGDPLARARIAVEFGLVGKAIDDVLLRSHQDLYG